MSEAQPSKKTGGHAYGRRHQTMSNTAEEGELCIYTGHSLGRFSTWDSQELKQLVEKSIAVIPSTSSPKEWESLLTKIATLNPSS
jgi:hypothetical protein